MRAFNRSTGKELARNLSVAATVLSRTKGLLGRRALPQGEGLLITPCWGVHSFLMKFPIDVLFLDKRNRVIAVVENLQPHRMTRLLPLSRSVIELPAGTVPSSETKVGNEVVID